MNLSGGNIIREPAGAGGGYWAGAPGAFYDATEKAWYLTYRIRRPRGVQPDRGGESRIARSTDLKTWQDIWRVEKKEYNSASIERSTLHRGPDKVWRYFTSYVDPSDGRWCTALLRGTDLARLNPGNVEPIFKAAPLKLEGVKDPWILRHENVFYMFLSVAVPTPKTTAQSHDTLDIYNTGQCLSATGLATSSDLDHWKWEGVVFQPEGDGWDRYCRRINSVAPVNGNFYAFYDGSAGHEENYEEKTGIAVSADLRHWRTLTAKGPACTSPHQSHSLRYIDAQPVGGKAQIFYEYAREDGAHDLRLLTIEPSQLQASLEELMSAGLQPA